MDRKDRIDGFGAALLIGFSALLGLNQVMVKLVNAGMEPLFQAGLRSAGAALCVLIFALVRGKRLSLTDGSFWPGMLCGVFFGLEFAFLFSGINLTSVARASVLFYTMPAWLAITAHFWLDEPLTRARALGLAAAILGVAIALSGGDLSGGQIWGDLLCLAGAVCWMAIPIMTRRTRLARSGATMQLLYQLVVSAPLLMLLATIPGTYIIAMTPGLWAMFGVQVVAVAAFGFLLWLWTLTVYPASDIASFGFLAPLFGVLFGWLILGEAIGWRIWVALGLVGVGLFLINRRPRI